MVTFSIALYILLKNCNLLLLWEILIDPTSLSRWRQRLGKEFLEKILQYTSQVALNTKTDMKNSLKRVNDTTIMEKNITHPTDDKNKALLMGVGNNLRVILKNLKNIFD